MTKFKTTTLVRDKNPLAPLVLDQRAQIAGLVVQIANMRREADLAARPLRDLQAENDRLRRRLTELESRG